MGSVNLRFAFAGSVEVSRRLDLGARSLEDLRPVAPALFAILQEEVLDNFLTEGRSAGAPFRKLTPAYLKWKVSAHRRNPIKYPGTTILELTGRLANSLVNPGATPDSIRIARSNSILFGTKVPYAAFQASQGRNALQMSGRAPQRLTEVIRRAVVGAMRRGVAEPDPFFVDQRLGV